MFIYFCSPPSDLLRRQEELRRMEEMHNQEMQKRKEMQLRYGVSFSPIISFVCGGFDIVSAVLFCITKVFSIFKLFIWECKLCRKK